MIKLQKKINYFEPGGSFLLRNSLLRGVEELREKNNKVATGLVDRARASVRNAKQTVDLRDKHLRTVEAKARRKNGMLNNTAAIQDKLYREGYFGNIPYEKAVDGVWGKATLDAYNRSRLKSTLDTKKSTLNTEKSTQSDFDMVKSDPEFQEWLYKSGGENAPWYRKVANVMNVGANYIYGLINPDGKVLQDWGEGTERQEVANALWNQRVKGTATISDDGHTALGGNSNQTESREDFVSDAKSGLWGSITNQLSNAANLPYHNIYGQSSDARFDSNGFHSLGDNYTFNNEWSDTKTNSKGEPIVERVWKDGEGKASLWGAVKRGMSNLSGVGGVKTAMESAASVRGVDNERHSDVEHVSMDDLNKWAREYINSKK